MSALSFAAGMKLLSQKNYQAVYDLAVSALRVNEKDPLAFFFLGLVANDHNQLEKALEFFAKAAEISPRTARYHAYHAKTLLRMGAQAEAKAAAQSAASLSITDAFVADVIGTVFSRCGDHAAALPLFKRAVKMNPKWPLFHYNLGASAQFCGDIPAARRAYEAVVSLDPKFYRAWFSLVSLDRQTETSNSLDRLQAVFNNTALTADGQLLVGHAIAKTLEDLGQFPESFDWLSKAKAKRKSEVSYNSKAVSRIFEAAKTSPAAYNVANVLYDIIPVFIVGLPRTGTTLVDRILSSHSDVQSAGELDLFSKIIRAKIGEHDAYSEALFRKSATIDFEEIGNFYRQEIAKRSDGSRYFVDKTPLNFFYAGLISQALPEAKIIALRRGAMDSCLSNYRQLFALGDSRYDYALGLDDMADFYRQFDSLISHWAAHLPKGSFTQISYEEIVRSQGPSTRELLAFCGLAWDAACLRFHENTSPTDTASSVQVRQPLYTGAIERWKKYGDRLDGLKEALGSLTQDGDLR